MGHNRRTHTDPPVDGRYRLPAVERHGVRFDYLATKLQLDFYMSQFSEEQLEYFYGFPAWATSGWAIAVWGALLGSILLLLRTRWALWAFVVSRDRHDRQLPLHPRP